MKDPRQREASDAASPVDRPQPADDNDGLAAISDLKIIADELAQADSTRGVIIYKLKERGAEDGLARQLADQALGEQKNSERMKGLGQIMLGVGVWGVGWILAFDLPRARRARTLLVLFVIGGILIFRGISRAATGRDTD